MIRLSYNVCWALVVGVFFYASVPVHALLIDSFSAVQNGVPESVSADGAFGSFGIPTIFDISPTVSDPIFSRRSLSVASHVPGESSSLIVDGGGSAVMGATSNAFSLWSIGYSSNGFLGPQYGPINVQPNDEDRFRLTFDYVSPNLEYLIRVTGSTVGDSNNDTYQPLSSTVIDVPFSSFSNSPDFTGLTSLEFFIENSTGTSGGTASLSQVETVPEPNLGALLAIGVLGISAVRQRARSRYSFVPS